MALLSKFDGIVIQMLHVPMVGARFSAFFGDCELVVGLWPVRIIQGEAPACVRNRVLRWARDHEQELASAWSRVRRRRIPQRIAPTCAPAGERMPAPGS